jgi:AraC family transcriptional regulator
MFPMMSLRIDSPRGPAVPSCPKQSPRRVLEQAGHLLMLAITFFESNREAARRCLADASELLGRQSQTIGTTELPLQGIRRPGGLAPWQANRALEYIEANLGSKITTREIAGQVALSKHHFSRAFKQSFGCAPMNYIAMQRVERAKLMMTSTRERLAAIALACGFADQSHLCRRFRSAVGISPSLWRRVSSA